LLLNSGTFGRFCKISDSLGYSCSFKKETKDTKNQIHADRQPEIIELVIRATFGDGSIVRKVYINKVFRPEITVIILDNEVSKNI
jgi:hypothetical protein